MTVCSVLYWPNPALMDVSEEVPIEEVKTESFKQLIQDMVDTCAYAKGMGIAAPQMGVLKRVILVPGSDNSPLILVNPVLFTPYSTIVTEEHLEGCLSFPGIYAKVRRPNEIDVQAQTAEGESFRVRLSGMEAAVVQHEFDHLEGKTLANYVGDTQRSLFRDKIQKQLRLAKRVIEKRTHEVEELKASIREQMTFSSLPPPEASSSPSP